MCSTVCISRNSFIKCIINNEKMMQDKLREFGCILRKMTNEKISEAKLREVKLQQLCFVYRLLALHLGDPPKRFTYTYHNNKTEKEVKLMNVTPQEMYRKYGEIDLSDFVCLVNDDRGEGETAPKYEVMNVEGIGYLGSDENEEEGKGTVDEKYRGKWIRSVEKKSKNKKSDSKEAAKEDEKEGGKKEDEKKEEEDSEEEEDDDDETALEEEENDKLSAKEMSVKSSSPSTSPLRQLQDPCPSLSLAERCALLHELHPRCIRTSPRYLNVPIGVLKNIVVQMIQKEKIPVWFGCSMGQFVSRSKAMMGYEFYNLDNVYGSSVLSPLSSSSTTSSSSASSDDADVKDEQVMNYGKWSKADRIRYQQTAMSHAMLFTGFNRSFSDEEIEELKRKKEKAKLKTKDENEGVETREKMKRVCFNSNTQLPSAYLTPDSPLSEWESNPPVDRWRVENSWGSDNYDGFLIMSDYSF
ncbi:putative Peptidase C1-like family [Monocercomonoides exilis]|uniref:putative Peptidase C1-like family n=1 Tax=Monocercomonoides exilis TaxID=2049356 RepID=UPI0035596992|nr:putative Peptidase C1-like family [Monocercomonoides exilis]|eukprot:MONOS_9393.1-p1 / transcript=MONOS_9393.1 / gene=MONOS_9393 / organism=Monocercomonoides_exilis_PA203 / gene_product=unspecified product / transcript_product=unspecified product / location=Mono_scaffold00387:1312-3137(-) / protein_length=468 / sequence_SO=supercontig / SO=protein_coding / is_pseudo=false